MMGERQAYGVDGGEVERELAGDAANAVGAEQLLHIGTGYEVRGMRGKASDSNAVPRT